MIKGLLISIFLFLSGCATTISGKVASPGVKTFNANEARVNIALLNQGGQDNYSVVVRVDEFGAFETTDDLPKGKYLVEALVPGYEAASQTVDVDGSKRVAIMLVPVQKSLSRGVKANMNIEVDRGTGGATLTPPNL